MKIYTFEDKTFQQRIDEFNELILDDTSEGSVRDAWKDYLSVTIEPAYYKAIWKISKGMCEILSIKYPSEVFGEVVQTNFNDELLTVEFRIEQVQDDKLELPEVCPKVPLEEIYPTIYQEHSTLNVENTADYLDRYRFFFNHIFLPFDSDEDADFINKNLIPRVKLFFELKNKQLSKATSSYLRHIIAEVKHIQFKRELLTNSIEEQEEFINNHNEHEGKDVRRDSKEAVAKLLELHMRMSKIKGEFEILVNPDMRDAYEFIKYGKRNESSGQSLVLLKNGSVDEQIKMLEQLKEKLPSPVEIQWKKSLSDAITCATIDSQIFIPSGKFAFKFLDFLYGNVCMRGIPKLSLDTINPSKMIEHFATIFIEEDSVLLFAIDGDMQFEDLIIDCRNVKTGFLIKSGKVSFSNCLIIGSNQSSVSEAFSVCEESHLLLTNCTISNFATGINIADESTLDMINSKIEKCSTGISIMGDKVKPTICNSIVSDADDGIIKYSRKIKKGNKLLSFDDQMELKEFGLDLSDTKTTVRVISKIVDDSPDFELEMRDEEEMVIDAV